MLSNVVPSFGWLNFSLPPVRICSSVLWFQGKAETSCGFLHWMLMWTRWMWIACQFKQLKGILGISIRPQAHRCMVGIFFCGHHLISTDADVDVGCLASNILANSGRLGLLRPGSFYCARPEKKKQKQKKNKTWSRRVCYPVRPLRHWIPTLHSAGRLAWEW